MMVSEPERRHAIFRAKNGTRTRDPDLGKVVLYQLSYFRMKIESQSESSQKIYSKSKCTEVPVMELGAKNGTRTRDPDLGKVVLYQLSYFRNISMFSGTHFILSVSHLSVVKRVVFPDCDAKLDIIFELTKCFC